MKTKLLILILISLAVFTAWQAVQVRPGYKPEGRPVQFGKHVAFDDSVEFNDTVRFKSYVEVDSAEVLTTKNGVSVGDTINFAETKWAAGDFSVKSEISGGNAFATSISYEGIQTSTKGLDDGLLTFSKIVFVKDTVLDGQRIPITTAGDFTASDFCGLALFKWNATNDTLKRVAITANVPDLFKTVGYRDGDYIASYSAEAGEYFVSALVNYSAQNTIPIARTSVFTFSPYDGSQTSYFINSQTAIASEYALADITAQTYWDIIQIVYVP